MSVSVEIPGKKVWAQIFCNTHHAKARLYLQSHSCVKFLVLDCVLKKKCCCFTEMSCCGSDYFENLFESKG